MTLTLKYIFLHSYQQCYITGFCPSYGRTVSYFKKTNDSLQSRYTKNKQAKTIQQTQLCLFDQNENLEMSLDYGLLIQRDCFAPDQKRPIAVQVVLVILVKWL